MSRPLPSTEDLERLAKAITPGPWEWAAPHCGDVHILLRWVDGETFPNGDQRYVQVHSDGSAGGEYSPDIDVAGPDANLIAIAPVLLREVLDRRASEASVNGRAVMTIYSCPTPQEITAWAESALRNVPDGSLTRAFMRELIAGFADGLSALRATPTTEPNHDR